MPVKSIEEPTNDQQEAERTRVSQRRSVKERLIEMDLRDETIAGLQSLIGELDRDDAEAKQKHAATTAEIDGELNKLDRATIDSLLGDGSPPKDASETRRSLLQRQQAADREYQELTEANRRSRAKLLKQITELQSQNAERTVLQNKLCDKLASPKLADQYHIIRSRLAWAQRRLEHANGELRKHSANQSLAEETNDYGGPAAYAQWIHKATIDRDDAASQVAELKEQDAAMRAEMMDE